MFTVHNSIIIDLWYSGNEDLSKVVSNLNFIPESWYGLSKTWTTCNFDFSLSCLVSIVYCHRDAYARPITTWHMHSVPKHAKRFYSWTLLMKSIVILGQNVILKQVVTIRIHHHLDRPYYMCLMPLGCSIVVVCTMVHWCWLYGCTPNSFHSVHWSYDIGLSSLHQAVLKIPIKAHGKSFAQGFCTGKIVA